MCGLSFVGHRARISHTARWGAEWHVVWWCGGPEWSRPDIAFRKECLCTSYVMRPGELARPRQLAMDIAFRAQSENRYDRSPNMPHDSRSPELWCYVSCHFLQKPLLSSLFLSSICVGPWYSFGALSVYSKLWPSGEGPCLGQSLL
jgi:hypothetical protein